MSNSGLVALSDNVRAYFALPQIVELLASYGMPAPTVTTTGWHQREQILNQGVGQANRISLIPGTIDGANLGGFMTPRRTGGNARVLVTWARVVTASVWAYDNSAPDDEQTQIAAGDNLMELFLQALIWTANADVLIDHANVRRDARQGSGNRAFGDERLIEFVHREPFFGLSQQVVTGATPAVERNPSS